jgi:hypothetical protein
VVDFQLSQATGTAEGDMVPKLVDQARERGFHPRTLGADKGYDTRDCVADLRQRQVTPHMTQNTSGRRSAAPSVLGTHGEIVAPQQADRDLVGLLERAGCWRVRGDKPRHGNQRAARGQRVALP